MKILYIAYIRFPSERAHAIQVAEMCNAFTEVGNTVTLLTTSRKKGINKNFQEYFGVDQQFTQKFVWVPEWAVNESLFTKLWQLWFALGCLLNTFKEKPDVVYSRDEWTLYLVSLFVPKQQIVWESHEGKWNQAAKHLFSRGVKCVAISDGIFYKYTKRGINPDQILIANDAVDQRFFNTNISQTKAREYLGIPTDEKVVMYVGGLDEWKGVDVLCQAAKTFTSQAKLYVIGGREEQLSDYKSRYPNVSFLGFHPYATLPIIQQAADILVIPNTAKNELSSTFTSPLKLYTYMASGVPVLASDVPSIRSVLGEDSCFYFTPDDPMSLSEIVNVILEKPNEAKKIAASAYNLAEDKTWMNRARSILEFAVIK